jgi:hypothetical protein
MAGDHVSISGFSFVAAADAQPPSALIGIDGVTDFVVSGNRLVAGRNGIFTRLASGRIEGNLAENNLVGFYLSGGSNRLPARLNVVGNRVKGSGVEATGISLNGAAETSGPRSEFDPGAHGDQFCLVQPPEFDRNSNPDEVPDVLDAEIVGNEVSGYRFTGIRLAGYLGDRAYSLPSGQEETANVRAVVEGNVIKDNRDFGLIVDAGDIVLDDRRMINMTLFFHNNTLEGNGIEPAIFSFWHFGFSIEEDQKSAFRDFNPTFAHDSTIEYCGDAIRFDYDNRQDPNRRTNPAPTNNRLSVNNIELVGYCVGDCFFEAPGSPSCP